MRITKKRMVEEYPAVSRAKDLLDLYLFDVENGRDADETEIVFNLRGKLFRATSATGGYVVLFHIPDIGQAGNTSIHYLDDLDRDTRDRYGSEYLLNLRILVERLKTARNRAFEKPVGQ